MWNLFVEVSSRIFRDVPEFFRSNFQTYGNEGAQSKMGRAKVTKSSAEIPGVATDANHTFMLDSIQLRGAPFETASWALGPQPHTHPIPRYRHFSHPFETFLFFKSIYLPKSRKVEIPFSILETLDLVILKRNLVASND